MGVATKLFLERGFAETTLEEIAKRAGVAKRTIYTRFKDKEYIFAAVVRARANTSVGRAFTADYGDLTFEAVIAKLAKETVQLLTHPDAIELNRLIVAEAQRFPELASEISAIGLLDLHSALAAVFEKLAVAGLMKLDASAQQVAVRFCDIIVGLSAMHLLQGVNWMIPDGDELNWRLSLFIAHYKNERNRKRLPGKSGA